MLPVPINILWPRSQAHKRDGRFGKIRAIDSIRSVASDSLLRFQKWKGIGPSSRRL